jgi:hypothetical protein
MFSPTPVTLQFAQAAADHHTVRGDLMRGSAPKREEA